MLPNLESDYALFQCFSFAWVSVRCLLRNNVCTVLFGVALFWNEFDALSFSLFP
jgi:hypothetical protein